MRLIINGSQLVDLTLALGSLDWWRKNFSVCLLVLSILASVFALVVVKTQTRQEFIDYQAMQYHQSQLKHEQSQLILEKGAFNSEMRVMSLAQNNLQMQMPQNKNVVLLQA
jgi:cell division protein FtsL